MEQSLKKERVHGIDFIRGLAVINMVLYHLLYDLVYIFERDIAWFTISKVYYWQQAIVISFIFVSGVSCFFSKQNIKRGGQIFIFALILSGVTYFVLPEEFIAFGVLHFLGLGILLFALLKKGLDKLPSGIGVLVFLVLFLVTKGLPKGFLGFGDVKLMELPYSFYSSDYLFWLGFPSKGFFSGDYVPMIPWFFLLILGYFSWKAILSLGYPKWFINMKYPLINEIGKKSLWIYMLHQPIIYGILLLILKNP